MLLKGVGPRTASKIIDFISTPGFDIKNKFEINYKLKGKDGIDGLFEFIKDMKLAKNEYEEALSYDPDNIQALINISGICICVTRAHPSSSIPAALWLPLCK